MVTSPRPMHAATRPLFGPGARHRVAARRASAPAASAPPPGADDADEADDTPSSSSSPTFRRQQRQVWRQGGDIASRRSTAGARQTSGALPDVDDPRRSEGDDEEGGGGEGAGGGAAGILTVRAARGPEFRRPGGDQAFYSRRVSGTAGRFGGRATPPCPRKTDHTATAAAAAAALPSRQEAVEVEPSSFASPQLEFTPEVPTSGGTVTTITPPPTTATSDDLTPAPPAPPPAPGGGGPWPRQVCLAVDAAALESGAAEAEVGPCRLTLSNPR
jgi:hypothetical protein